MVDVYRIGDRGRWLSMLGVGALPAPAARAEPAALPRNRVRVPAVLTEAMRASRGHALWILAWSVVGWIGIALTPALVGRPFVLMMLSPRAVFAALAADGIALVPFVLLGTLRLGVTDASYFLIGRRLPEVVAARPGLEGESSATSLRTKAMRPLRLGDRTCRWLCAHSGLAALVLFFRPNGKYLGLAGAYGVSSSVAASASILGTASFLTALHLGVGFVA